MSTTEILLTRLRANLKAQGVTYAELARRMCLSEVTIKRVFSGRTEFTIERLDAVCRALQLDPVELLRRSSTTRQAPRAQLTEAQETALARDLGLFRLFSALLKGRTFPGRRSAPLARDLARLVRLGLVQDGPEGPRVHVARRYQWLPGGPLARRYGAELRADFLASPFQGEGEASHFHSLVFSPRSRKVAFKLAERFVQDLQRLSLEDLLVDPKVEGTLTCFLGMRPWVPSMFGDV